MSAARTIAALIALAPAMASADPHTGGSDTAHDAHSRLSLTLGLFTPTGELGIEYALVLPYLEVAAGAGIGGLGPQASIMPRLRVGNRAVSFTLGAGISGGPYHDPVLICLTTDSDQCMSTSTTVLWANIEAGLSWTWGSGSTLRLYGGAGRIVEHGECTGPGCDGLDGSTLPYFGIAIGHTL